jgi:hypothetical protein
VGKTPWRYEPKKVPHAAFGGEKMSFVATGGVIALELENESKWWKFRIKAS